MSLLKTAKKPTRTPPPPPPPSNQPKQKQKSSKNLGGENPHYILISDCSTGIRNTNFSDCSTGIRNTNFSVHLKSNSEYSYLPVERSQITRNSAPSTPTDSKQDYILAEIDFPRTTALGECKAERTKTR